MRFNDIIQKWIWAYVTKTGIVLLGKSDPPPAPDPVSTANAQSNSNVATANASAALNRPNTVTPTGNQTWSLRPGADPANPKAGDWTVTNSLSAAGQQQLDATNAAQATLNPATQGLASQVAGNLSSGLDTSGLPAAVGTIGNRLPAMGATPTSPGVNNVTEALYHKQTGMLDPQFQQSESSLQAKLANQGITQGSEAYNREMGNAARAKEFAYGNARDSAILAGGAEDTRQYNQGLAGAQFQNASNQQAFGQSQAQGDFSNKARATALAEAITKRELPLNELNALKTGNPIAMPNFQNTSTNANVAGTDIAGLVGNNYQAQVASNNASNAQTTQTAGTVASLAMTAAMMY